MAAGQLVLALATDVPDRGGRPRAGRRRRRDDLHQRAAAGRAVVPRPDGPAGHPAHRHPRPARLRRGGLSAGRPAARHVLARRRSSAPPATGVLVAVLVLVALRDAPPGTVRRARRPAWPSCGAAWPTRGGSPARASGCTRTWSPSSPARSSRCCGAIRSWWSARAGPRRRRPGCSPCSWSSAMCVGPLLGRLCGRWPLRRSDAGLRDPRRHGRRVDRRPAVAGPRAAAAAGPPRRRPRHQRAGLDDRLRLRPHLEPGRAAGQRQRRRQRRRVRRLAAHHPGRGRRPRPAHPRVLDRLQPGRVPCGVRRPVPVLGASA